MYNIRKTMCFWDTEACKSILVDPQNKTTYTEYEHNRPSSTVNNTMVVMSQLSSALPGLLRVGRQGTMQLWSRSGWGVCVCVCVCVCECVCVHILTLLCSALCLGQLKRKVLKMGIHMLSLSTVRYVSVNSNADGY